MEIVVTNKGVIYFDEKKPYFGGRSKAKFLKDGGIIKIVDEAMKIRKC